MTSDTFHIEHHPEHATPWVVYEDGHGTIAAFDSKVAAEHFVDRIEAFAKREVAKVEAAMNNAVFLVVFETGEYGDMIEQPMAAFLKKPEANAFAALVEAELVAMGLDKSDPDCSRRDYGDLEVSYTGAWVSVEGPVPLAPKFVSCTAEISSASGLADRSWER